MSCAGCDGRWTCNYGLTGKVCDTSCSSGKWSAGKCVGGVVGPSPPAPTPPAPSPKPDCSALYKAFRKAWSIWKKDKTDGAKKTAAKKAKKVWKQCKNLATTNTATTASTTTSIITTTRLATRARARRDLRKARIAKAHRAAKLRRARREARQARPSPEPIVTSRCRWSGMHKDKYIGGCSQKCARFKELAQAKVACAAEKTCGGVTLEHGKWELRSGPRLAQTPKGKGENSYVCDSQPWHPR